MSSTVACIGFTDPSALASIVREHGEPFHEFSSTMKWVDSSGAMLLLDRTGQFARPGFATPVRTPYNNIVPLEGGLAQVHVTDVSGYELEPFTVIPDARYTVGWARTGRVALVAMGVDTEFFPTAEDFFDSPRSALPGFDGEPPAEVKQFGLPWPPLMEIETFMPEQKQGEALALLSGTVQFAEVRKNSSSGHEFLVSRVATVCGEIDLCTPLPLDGPPEPGAVAVGQVQLLAGFPPHGVEDTSTYVAPEPPERVSPTFRDGDPEQPDIIEPEDEEPLPEGLVLGEDGVVRSAEEHSAWKGGDAEAGSRPSGQPADRPAPAGAVGEDTAPPASEPQPAEGVAPGQEQVASASRPTEQGGTPARPTSPQATSSPDDDSPRPGETRREWRARTGR